MATFSKCSCEHCGAHLEFPDDAAGATIACPQCQGQTTLRAGQPRPQRAAEPPAKGGSRSGRLAVIMILVLVAGSLGGWAALKKFSTAKTPARTESVERSSSPKERAALVPESVSFNSPELPAAGIAAVGEIKKGREVYLGKCAKCHQFYDPAAYNDFDWNHWMGRMRGEAKLNGDQAELLNRFLRTVRNP